MDPVTIIEISIASVIVAIFLVGSSLLFWLKRRKVGFIITGFLILSIISFLIARPYWTDYQINIRTIELEKYLKHEYPDVNWKISHADFRKHKHVNPYYLLVNFSDDLNITYYYYVDSNGNVEQMGGYAPEGVSLFEGKYFKEEE